MKRHAWLMGLAIAITVAGCKSEVTSFDACPVAGPELLFTHLGDLSVTVTSHDDFAWFGSSSGIYSVDLRTNQPLLLAAVNSVALAASATHVYALSGAGDIVAVDRTTGVSTAFGDSAVIGSVESIAVDGAWLYAGGQSGLFRVSLVDQNVEAIDADLDHDHIEAIAVGARGRVFFQWYSNDETQTGVSSVSIGDGDVVELSSTNQAGGFEAGARTLAVDDAYVYWTDNSADGEIERVAQDGGVIETIGSFGGLMRGLAVSHGTVFASGIHGVQRSRPDHGPMDTVLDAVGSSPIEATSTGLVFAAGAQAFLLCRPVS